MANHIQLVMYEGFLGADPESRFLDSGNQVCNFRFGSSRKYKKNEETVEETIWIKAVAWGSLAKIINDYCAKGSHVIVTGRLRGGKDGKGSPEVFEKKDGSFGANFEMTVESIRILDGKDGKTTSPETSSTPVTAEGDFPF